MKRNSNPRVIDVSDSDEFLTEEEDEEPGGGTPQQECRNRKDDNAKSPEKEGSTMWRKKPQEGASRNPRRKGTLNHHPGKITRRRRLTEDNTSEY